MLAMTRKNIGDYNFSSQYQQNPIPKGGAIVKADWLRYYEADPPPSSRPYILQSWDTANKSTELSDFSVCTTWLAIGENYYLLNVFRKRLDYPELRRAVMDLNERYQTTVILIEDKASGTSLIQDLQTSGLSKVKAYTPISGMDKVMRLYAQTALFENGQVFLPKEASWLDEYRLELISFPGMKHDDQVDSTTQALDYMNGEQSKMRKKMDIWAKLGR